MPILLAIVPMEINGRIGIDARFACDRVHGNNARLSIYAEFARSRAHVNHIARLFVAHGGWTLIRIGHTRKIQTPHCVMKHLGHPESCTLPSQSYCSLDDLSLPCCARSLERHHSFERTDKLGIDWGNQHEERHRIWPAHTQCGQPGWDCCLLSSGTGHAVPK